MERRTRRERRLEARTLPVDEHVEVPAQDRARVAHAVEQPGPSGVEGHERLAHRGPVHLGSPLRAVDEGHERARQHDRGHRGPRQSTTAVSTDQMAGRSSAIRRHETPSSDEPNNDPVEVPK